MNNLEKSLLNDFQRQLPLSETPYADMAERLGVTEEQVIRTLADLQAAGSVSRVGAVFDTSRIGASSLVAMAVPADRLEEVARIVNGYAETNHNYEREHHFNLWYVLTAGSDKRLQQVLDEIESRTGLKTLYLPMVEAYHLDLGFRLQWAS